MVAELGPESRLLRTGAAMAWSYRDDLVAQDARAPG
jgi:hypothetical protein